ncbi:MAG: glycosyltransferase family 4 protein [Bacteroidales bacterium]|nr:glycosyltransferase family 4 protein [Bacteroidales bacterium]
MSLRILFIQRIFSDYRKAIFDRLSEKYILKLIHSRNKSGIIQVTAPYSKIIPSYKYGKKETNMLLFVLPTIISFKPHIIVHEFTPSIISLHLSFLYAKIMGVKFVLWGHGYNRNFGFDPKNSFSSKIRLFYLKYSDAVILYSYDAKKELSKYVNAEKLYVAPNTLNTNALLKIKDNLNSLGENYVKQQIKFIHDYNLIFIGRLLKNKLPDVLIAVYEKLAPVLNNNVAIHYIGDGVMLPMLKRIVHQKQYEENIFFHGEIHDDFIIGQILFASDIMVMPGYVGLAVNHAFCFDCPVATYKQGQNGPFHSPEVEYIEDSKTGFLAESYNLDDLSKKILDYLTNPDLQEKMKKNINYLIRNKCSINNMLQGFLDCFNSFENNKSE